MAALRSRRVSIRCGGDYGGAATAARWLLRFIIMQAHVVRDATADMVAHSQQLASWDADLSCDTETLAPRSRGGGALLQIGQAPMTPHMVPMIHGGDPGHYDPRDGTLDRWVKMFAESSMLQMTMMAAANLFVLGISAGAYSWLTKDRAPIHDEDEEVEPRVNDHFEEDVYGFAISAAVRDLHMIAHGEGTFAVQMFRCALAVIILNFSMALQCYLLAEIRFLCTALAVDDIRETYNAFEFHMYGSNESHVTRNIHGHVRGLPDFFNPDLFGTLPEELKRQVCILPMSQPGFLAVLLFVWTITCMGEVRRINSLFVSLIVAMPTKDTMCGALVNKNSFAGEDPEEAEQTRSVRVIVHLTYSLKVGIFTFIMLPRLILTSVLLYLGCRWLMSTDNFSDVFLDSVALEFVMYLKNLLYHALLPGRTKRDCTNTEIHPPTTHEQASVISFAGTIAWGTISGLWCYFYMCRFQQVLPDFNWDMKAACMNWASHDYHS